jgi:DUF917 family protein
MIQKDFKKTIVLIDYATAEMATSDLLHHLNSSQILTIPATTSASKKKCQNAVGERLQLAAFHVPA